MKYLIPEDSRINVVLGDFWRYTDDLITEDVKTDYDVVIMDIWWGSRSMTMGHEMFVLRCKLKAALPNATIMTWGLRDPQLNPAVTIDDSINLREAYGEVI